MISSHDATLGPAGVSLFGSASKDGRFVAFQTDGADMVAGFGGRPEVFLRDSLTGTLTCVSAVAGRPADDRSGSPSISGDGSRVAYASLAGDLVAGDTNGLWDVFVFDAASRETTLVSVNAGGISGNGASHSPAISADGRFVAFSSSASDLVGGDSGLHDDVFVRDLLTRTTTRVSVGLGGAEADGDSVSPAISADGRYVAFASTASNLIAGDSNGASDVFVFDRLTRTTKRASVSNAGVQGNLGSYAPAIDGDGSRVAFESLATNLTAGDSGRARDVFVRDIPSATTTRVSVSASGAEGDAESCESAISADGVVVAFSSLAGNLVAGDTNGASDVFAVRLGSPAVTRLSVSASGAQGLGPSAGVSLSSDGSHAVFHSDAPNLVAGDAGGTSDVFSVAFGPRAYTRLAGADEYATAVEVSKHGFPAGADAVLLAGATKWPDALGGSALAGVAGGPLLPCNLTTIPPVVAAEIVRLSPARAYILGGTGSVGPAVEARLRALVPGITVTRLGGIDRYAAGRAIAGEVLRLSGSSFDGSVLLATGGNYPDALAGAPVASRLGRPIVLVNPYTNAFTLPAGTKRAYILGGTGSVSPAAERALRTRLGTANVRRFAGIDRYEVAALVAAWGVGECGLSWDGVTLASGQTFNGALAGGVMAGRTGTVVLLTRSTLLPVFDSTRLSAVARQVAEVHIVGSTSSVSASVLAALKRSLGD